MMLANKMRIQVTPYDSYPTVTTFDVGVFEEGLSSLTAQGCVLPERNSL